MVLCFLQQLQQPVCLIAHNGDKFDFPLLKKQFDIFDGIIPPTILCCDSLTVFREIDDKKLNAPDNLLEGIKNLNQSDAIPIVISLEQEIIAEANLIGKDATSSQFNNQNMIDMQKYNETTPKRKFIVTQQQTDKDKNLIAPIKSSAQVC